MKSKFGEMEGRQNYYMVRNCPTGTTSHFFWYLDKMCLLAKSSYMSKEVIIPLYHAQRGLKMDWASWVYEHYQLGELKDNQRFGTKYQNNKGVEHRQLTKYGSLNNIQLILHNPSSNDKRRLSETKDSPLLQKDGYPRTQFTIFICIGLGYQNLYFIQCKFHQKMKIQLSRNQPKHINK